MATYYEKNMLIKQVSALLTNKLTLSEIQSFIESLSLEKKFDDTECNLILLVFFKIFKREYSSYPAYLQILSDNLENKIFMQILENLVINDEDSAANNFDCPDCDKENDEDAEYLQAKKKFSQIYKRIDKEQFPDVKFPSVGEGLLKLTDNKTFPGETWYMDLILDPEGKVLEIRDLTKKHSAKDYNEIFQGILKIVEE